MQRKSTYQPWSDRQKKAKSTSNKEMSDTCELVTERQGEETRLGDGDPQCSQGKSSRRMPKMKAVKVTPAVADILVGSSKSPGKRSGSSHKEHREELVAAVIEKRRALVARQMASPNVGVPGPRGRTSEEPSKSGRESAQEHHVNAAMGRTCDEVPGGTIHISLEGNSASEDLMELSPTRVRMSGMFSAEVNDFPRGSSQKPRHRKHRRECSESLDYGGRSDGERIAHGKSKGCHRLRRDKSESDENDQSPQGYRRYGELRQRKYRQSGEFSSDYETTSSPRYRRHSLEYRRKSHHGRHRHENETSRYREGCAQGKRKALQTSEDEYERYGSVNLREPTRHTMSPSQTTFHAKRTSGEEPERHAGMLPWAKSDIPYWKAEVKEGPLSESALRRDRKCRQVSREAEVEKREKMGRKPHFLTVDDRGRPYGLGAKSWRAELNKLCCALDPSVMDVRNQPHKPMMTLKKRLACKFEYSADIDDDWLRGEIGRGVSTRRFQLMEIIRNGDQMPPGFDKGVWYTLQRISDDPKYKEKSEAMRHANSMRRTKGRTGPKGETGIVEDLREHFGRSPDPDEIDLEMQRDKGYAGASGRKRRGLNKEDISPLAKRKTHEIPITAEASRGDDSSGGMEYKRGASRDVYCDIPSPNRSAGGHDSRYPLSAAEDHEAYVQALLKQLADMEARAAASNLLSSTTELHLSDSRQQMPEQSGSPEGIGEDHETGAQNNIEENGGGLRVLRNRMRKGKVGV